jgi:Transposase DDE domain
MRGQSQQIMLDSYFGSLASDGDWQRVVSGRGFAKARERLSWSALGRLNTFVVDCADKLGLVPRWQGLRVVAADASALMPAIRPCFTSRRLAHAEQRLFTLYLPGAELTLHASVHATSVPERQMLFEALECLGPDDVLVLDRGYPAKWLVAHLTEQKIRFCMRCDKANGWKGMRALIQSGQPQAIVPLGKPSRQDAADYLCAGTPTHVRLVRMVTPDGQIRVVATNLPAQDFPAEVFAELYHQRWRIEEAFKRLKHRAKLESVSGLTQHALLVDVYSKVLGDNLGSLVCQGASEHADLPTKQRCCNRAYAAPCLQRLLPRMVLGLGQLVALLEKAFGLLGANWHRRVPDRAQPRPKRHVKPHPNLAYKG